MEKEAAAQAAGESGSRVAAAGESWWKAGQKVSNAVGKVAALNAFKEAGQSRNSGAKARHDEEMLYRSVNKPSASRLESPWKCPFGCPWK